MKTIIDLLNKEREVGLTVLNLNTALAQKSAVAYKNYLDNGGNERAAKDKVIDNIKIDDSAWLELEDKYSRAKLYLKYLQSCVSCLEYVLDKGEFIQSIETD